MPKKLSHEDYEQKLNEREIDILPIEPYSGSRNPILHECINEHIWLISPSNVLAGKRCPYCVGNKKHTVETYSKKLIDMGILSYKPSEEYINISTPILHTCMMCNNKWKVRPNDILRGKGCPNCSSKGFKTSKEAIVYFISFEHENITYYKIGVTNHSTEYRFGSQWDKYNMKVIWDILFSKGYDALKLEKEIKHKYSEFLLNTGILLNGNTETFSIEIPKPKIVLDF